jgi:hypothetical protein
VALSLVKNFGTVPLQAGRTGTLPASGGQSVAATDAQGNPIVGMVLAVQQAGGAAGGWVRDGSDALRIDSLQVSYDGGATWTDGLNGHPPPLITNEVVQDVAVAPVVKNGVTIWPADTAVVGATFDPQVGPTPRQIRASYTVLKAVTINPTLYSANNQ